MSEKEKKGKKEKKEKGEKEGDEKEKEDKNKKKDKKGKEKEKEGDKEEKNKDIKNEENKDQPKLNESKENKQNIIANTNSDNNNNITSAFPILPSSTKTPLQMLSSINNEMDSLSNTLKTKFSIFSSPYTFNKLDFNINYTPSVLNNNFGNYYDKEDFEIKELIIKANKLINDRETNIKFNNNINNSNSLKKFENKITQSDEINFKKYLNNKSNFFNNNINNINNNINLNDDYNLNNNYNLNNKFNTKTDFFKNKNNNNNFMDFENNNNIYKLNNKYNYNKNELDIDKDFYRINNNRNRELLENNYRERKNKSINNPIRLNRNDFMNNNNEEINNDNNNIIFKKYQNFNISTSQKNDGNSIDFSINNKTKKIEDLYKFTNNPRRRPMVYTQPDSRPINNKLSSRIERGSNGENNFKNNNGSYSTVRDNNNYLKKNSYLRFDNEGVNLAMDILNGKI